jgi:organic radical activating enzyme
LFENSNCIFKITGGEPLIQQKQLIKFVQYMKDRYFQQTGKANRMYIDFETNATITPDKYWEFNATFTTSPKLSSNGDSEDKRYVPEVLKWHAMNWSDFKFVIQNENDINEVNNLYVNKFNISKKQVFLMPCCGSRKELIEKSAQVAEWCKQYGFSFSPRLQLLIWDKALKV